MEKRLYNETNITFINEEPARYAYSASYFFGESVFSISTMNGAVLIPKEFIGELIKGLTEMKSHIDNEKK